MYSKDLARGLVQILFTSQPRDFFSSDWLVWVTWGLWLCWRQQHTHACKTPYNDWTADRYSHWPVSLYVIVALLPLKKPVGKRQYVFKNLWSQFNNSLNYSDLETWQYSHTYSSCIICHTQQCPIGLYLFIYLCLLDRFLACRCMFLRPLPAHLKECKHQPSASNVLLNCSHARNNHLHSTHSSERQGKLGGKNCPAPHTNTDTAHAPGVCVWRVNAQHWNRHFYVVMFWSRRMCIQHLPEIKSKSTVCYLIVTHPGINSIAHIWA